MSAAKRLETVEGGRKAGYVSCEFSEINSPGLYVEHHYGTLLRVPEDAVAPGRSPLMSVVSQEPWIVTRISTDPFLPLTKARLIAANLDLAINF